MHCLLDVYADYKTYDASISEFVQKRSDEMTKKLWYTVDTFNEVFVAVSNEIMDTATIRNKYYHANIEVTLTDGTEFMSVAVELPMSAIIKSIFQCSCVWKVIEDNIRSLL